MKYWLKLNELKAVERRAIFFMSYIRFIIFFVVILLLVTETATKATKIMGQSKEPIRLRQRKTASGNTTLYLDIYLNGKRSYEYLKLYLIPETNRKDKEKNRQTLQLAEAIRAKRVVELQNGELRASSKRRRKDVI